MSFYEVNVASFFPFLILRSSLSVELLYLLVLLAQHSRTAAAEANFADYHNLRIKFAQFLSLQSFSLM